MPSELGTLEPELQGRIAAWSAQDPDPGTRAELEHLLTRAASGDLLARAELADAFAGRLEFGTAGLRGALGPGPNRMNRVVVGQAAAALTTYLHDAGHAGGRVLIGYDARHGSVRFATDTAEILAGAGFDARLIGHPLPTPVVAFGIRHLGCAAAVVVTASHNPAADNGYKVYLGDGSQIVPPVDTQIAARIEEIALHDLADVPRSTAYAAVGPELEGAYLERAASLVPRDVPHSVAWVYTPLHGVGGDLVLRAVQRCGFPAPIVVSAQAAPDPDFPTVAFPNPEEPGALDLALAAADDVDVVVANDPDADRCAVATRIAGEWRVLTGDQLGALLADDALRSGRRGTYACSIVSSSLLETMAAAYAQPFRATLTGFKWIGRVPGLVFGYEEAIGYCVDPAAVPDKDGITALLRVLALVAQLKAEGQTLTDRLDEIARSYGVVETTQISARFDDLTRRTDAMASLRADPPRQLAGGPVTVTDLTAGRDGLPPTDAIRFDGEGLRVIVRPSGTEPKLKCYLEVRRPYAVDRDLAAQRAAVGAVLDRVADEMRERLDV